MTLILIEPFTNQLYASSFYSIVSILQAEVFVDIECEPKHLDKVIRLLKREVRSVSYASPQVSDEFPPPTPLSACSSFG